MLVGIGSRIEKEVYDKIVKEAKENKTTRSEIIRHHLKKYYELKEKHRELFKVFNRMHSEIERLQKENESLKTKVKNLERILEYKKELEEKKEKERKNRLWKWLKEHFS